MKRIPTFKGRTAWDLLNRVCQLIEAEPKRYNQGNWLELLEDNPGYQDPSRFPDCGTIGCVAGWVSALVQGRKVASALSCNFTANNREFLISVRARQILGLTKVQSDELFAGEALVTLSHLLDPSYDTSVPLKGTSGYAAYGVFHIYRFMHKYEQQLRRKRVVRG